MLTPTHRLDEVAFLSLNRRSGGRLWVAVDVADLPVVARYRWSAHVTGRSIYARTQLVIGGRRVAPYMHVLLLGTRGVDHLNGNGLDNRRVNLRPADKSQNAGNSRAHLGSTSSFKGVCWDRRREKWLAQIRFAGRRRHLGRYGSEVEAARAYDEAALDLFGEYARLNFPQGGQTC